MGFKELLQSKGVKQVELARHLGYKQSLISHWIVGTCEPNIKSLKEISAYLKIPIDSVIDCFNYKKAVAARVKEQATATA